MCTSQSLITFTGLQEAHGQNCLSEQQYPIFSLSKRLYLKYIYTKRVHAGWAGCPILEIIETFKYILASILIYPHRMIYIMLELHVV